MSAVERWRTAYAPIGEHAVIGDRRAAALVASDGTIDWLCLPWYNVEPTFGALLDAERGGFWRVGPDTTEPMRGTLGWENRAPVSLLTWEHPDWTLELRDAFILPQDDRDEANQDTRVLVRDLRCTRGAVDVRLDCAPIFDMRAAPREVFVRDDVASFVLTDDLTIHVWNSIGHGPGAIGRSSATATLSEGESVVTVLSVTDHDGAFGIDAARAAVAETVAYWDRWTDALTLPVNRTDEVRRSAMVLHLLTCAPAGATLAAPTTSLPPLIGGDSNWDYRYAWIRDASLSSTVLSRLGKKHDVARYLDWITQWAADERGALGVMYRFDGGNEIHEIERGDVAGYRGSAPVRYGNAAWDQLQHDLLGFMMECAESFEMRGGRVGEHLTRVIAHAANTSAAQWMVPDAGIWEMRGERFDWVSGKVMAWRAMVGAARIVTRGGETPPAAWLQSAAAARAWTLDAGWDAEAGTFRQRAGHPGVDASSLLIPLTGMLAFDDPRVTSTLQVLRERLMVDDVLYRYEPGPTHGTGATLGETEGGFLPCQFWLAAVHARRGELDHAEALLARVERVAGPLRLFAEGLDPIADEFVGNHPLLFSHAEYIRAALDLDDAINGRAAPVPVGSSVLL